jgi:hypothetical protein
MAWGGQEPELTAGTAASANIESSIILLPSFSVY